MRIDVRGKSSAFVSEEPAFEKAGWHRRAVHLDQISVSTGAELVNRSRNDFLAGAGLSGNQDSGIRARHGPHLVENGAQAAATPYDRAPARGIRAFWPAVRPSIGTLERGLYRRPFRVSTNLPARISSCAHVLPPFST